ncbi:MAG: hypothetical protein AAF677_05965 [Pseudomonadota bacterium]
MAEPARDRLDAMNAQAMAAADVMADLVGCFCLAHARTPSGMCRSVWEGDPA